MEYTLSTYTGAILASNVKKMIFLKLQKRMILETHYPTFVRVRTSTKEYERPKYIIYQQFEITWTIEDRIIEVRLIEVHFTPSIKTCIP